MSSCIIAVVLMILGGLAFGMLAKHRQKTEYVANRNIVIAHNLNEAKNDVSRNGGNPIVDGDMAMMSTYQDIAEDPAISASARQYLPSKIKKQYNTDKINDSIKAKSHQQSLVLTISSKTKSAKDSVAIANAAAKAMKKELPEIQPGAGKVRLLEKATAKNATSETTPHAKKYALVGAALGLLIGLVVAFLRITLKDIVKSGK